MEGAVIVSIIWCVEAYGLVAVDFRRDLRNVWKIGQNRVFDALCWYLRWHGTWFCVIYVKMDILRWVWSERRGMGAQMGNLVLECGFLKLLSNKRPLWTWQDSCCSAWALLNGAQQWDSREITPGLNKMAFLTPFLLFLVLNFCSNWDSARSTVYTWIYDSLINITQKWTNLTKFCHLWRILSRKWHHLLKLVNTHRGVTKCQSLVVLHCCGVCGQCDEFSGGRLL